MRLETEPTILEKYRAVRNRTYHLEKYRCGRNHIYEMQN